MSSQHHVSSASPSKKRSNFPSALVLIMGMIVLVQLVSHLVPQGKYQRVKGADGRQHVVKGSYQELPEADRTSLGPLACISAIPKAMATDETPQIIFFVLLIGGAIGVLKRTGTIDAAIGWSISRLGTRPQWLIAGMVTVFAFGSSMLGVAEEYLPFLPLLVSMFIALGLDAVVALGTVCIGYSVGYGCAVMNPFTVGVAQGVAEVPAGTGQGLRWIIWVVALAVGIHHLLSYARRIRQNPSASLVADVDYSDYARPEKAVPLTLRHAMVLMAFAATVGLFIWGVQCDDWYFQELAALFVGFGIACAVIGKLHWNDASDAFLSGAAELCGAAILIGFAKTIEYLMIEAQIIDTVVHWIETGISGFGASVSAVAMLVVQSMTNFLIPSGSGQAVVTMPIMKDIADVSHVTRQTSVLAYQFGDGFTNIIVPTNAVLMGMLAIARVPYQRWFRFLITFFLKMYVIAIGALLWAVHTEWTGL